LLAAFCFCFVSVTTTFLAADEVVVFAPDETPASSEKEPPEIPALKNLSDVRLLPIFSVTQNIAATFRLKNALQKRETLHPDAVNYLDNALLFTLITEFPQTSWTPPSIFRIDAMMTRPAISYYGDFVVPVWPELLEAMKSEGDAKLLEPNVYDADGVFQIDTALVVTGKTSLPQTKISPGFADSFRKRKQARSKTWHRSPPLRKRSVALH
jgi:hypothetical protein